MAPELYLGLMSGTSMDGVSAAIVDLSGDKINCLASSTTDYPPELRSALQDLAAANWTGSLKDIQELDLDVARFYVQCANALLKQNNLSKTDLTGVGSHGQTICHTPAGEHRSSWQIGDANIISEHLGTTIADWRRRDMAAGGQGAPVTPAFHRHLLTGSDEAAVLNLGGIANITICNEHWLGFDPGPANILIDNWVERCKAAPFDDQGNWAREGKVDEELLGSLMADPYFALPPPKSTGREYFNLDWLQNKLYETSISPKNIQATLTELTAASVQRAIQDNGPSTKQLFVCGGGVHNTYLMERISALNPDIAVQSTQVLGVDPDYVEAIAFAWMAKATLNGVPGNIPVATGASGDRILGAIYQA